MPDRDSLKMKRIRSVAGPDPGYSDSLTPGSEIRDGKKSGSWISDGCKLPVPKFNVADPDPLSVWSWIREPGSAINILDPATLRIRTTAIGGGILDGRSSDVSAMDWFGFKSDVSHI
jgi:hypothetical protein